MYSKCPLNNDIRGTQAISLQGSVNMVTELTAFKQDHAFVLEGKDREGSFREIAKTACRNHRPIALGSETCRYAKGTKEGKKMALQTESLVRVLDLMQGTSVYC